MIKDRNLKPGTALVASYKDKTAQCDVIPAEKGEGVAYQLRTRGGKPGDIFKSPSAAGSKVMGGIACNGWRFWSVGETGHTLNAKAKAKAKPKAAAKRKAKVGSGANGPTAVTCGLCGEVLPDAAAAADHLENDHSGEEVETPA